MAVRRRAVIAALALAVLLAHTAAIDWIAARWQPPASKKPLGKPMYTRQITPRAPPAAQQAPASPEAGTPSAPRPRASIATVEKRSSPPKPGRAAPPKPATPATAAGTPPPGNRQTAAHEAERPPAGLPGAQDPDAPAAHDAPDPTPGPAASATASAGPGPVAGDAASSSESWTDWPTDTRLRYQLGGHYLGELHGSAQVLWQREGSDYEAVIEIDLGLLANLKLTSRGRITAHGLAPQFYEELQRTRRRVLRLEDDRVVLNDGRRVDRPAQVQDTTSQLVELAHRFRTGRVPLDAGRSLGFWLARPGGIGWWTYDVAGKVVLATPRLGAVEAFHLKPQPLAQPGGGSISAEIWFAPSLQYLPVKIRLSLNEAAWVELVVERIDQR